MRPKFKLTDANVQEIARLYTTEGMNLKQLAEMYKVSITTIRHHLRKQKVQIRRKGPSHIS